MLNTSRCSECEILQPREIALIKTTIIMMMMMTATTTPEDDQKISSASEQINVEGISKAEDSVCFLLQIIS